MDGRQSYTWGTVDWIIECYTDLLLDTDQALPEISKEKHRKPGNRVEKSYLRLDFDNAVDRIGDNPDIWHNFVQQLYQWLNSTNSDVTLNKYHFGRMIADLNGYQKAIAKAIWGIKPVARQRRKLQAAKHKIVNRLNHNYTRTLDWKEPATMNKPIKETKRYEVHLPIESQERFEKLVKGPASKVMRSLVDTVGGFTKSQWSALNQIANVEGVDLSIIMRNAILCWLIRVDEHITLYGSPDSDDLKVVEKDIDFEEVYRPTFRRDLELELCDQLLQNEAFGIPLESWEADLLIKHRLGNAWHNSLEYKMEQKQKARYKKLKAQGKIKTRLEWASGK